MSDNSEDDHKPGEGGLSDRMQYLIGTLLSVVIVVIYLIVTGEGG